MPTPKDGYHLKDGTPVPRTTEIIDAFDPKFGLRDWIYNTGIEAGLVRASNARYPEAPPLPEVSYKDKRDSAGSVGTAVHAMIQAYIKGFMTETEFLFSALSSLQRENVNRSFEAFTKWVDKKEIEWLETEVELVSEAHRYGGTLDAVGVMEGKLVLFDWKTAAGAYPSHLLQLAAYRQLWNENNPLKRIEQTYMVRFSKTDATFEPYPFSDLDAAWRVFYHHRRALYDTPKIAAALKEARKCMKLEISLEKSSGD